MEAPPAGLFWEFVVVLAALVLVGATPPLDAVDVWVWVVDALAVGVDAVLVAVEVTVVGAVAVDVAVGVELVVELGGAAV